MASALTEATGAAQKHLAIPPQEYINRFLAAFPDVKVCPNACSCNDHQEGNHHDATASTLPCAHLCSFYLQHERPQAQHGYTTWHAQREGPTFCRPHSMSLG